MTVTIARPALNTHFGPGYLVQASSNLGLPPAGAWWRGEITFTSGDPRRFTFRALTTPGFATVTAPFGIDSIAGTYTTGESFAENYQSVSAIFGIHYLDGNNVELDGAATTIQCDWLTGLPFLLGWLHGFNGGPGGGQDSLLQQILHDVQHTYVNSP